MTTVLKNIFFIALNWLLTTSATTKTRLSLHFMGNFVWQDFVTVKKYRLVSIRNGQLSTRTRVILLWATPAGLRPNRASPDIIGLLFGDRGTGVNNLHNITTPRYPVETRTRDPMIADSICVTEWASTPPYCIVIVAIVKRVLFGPVVGATLPHRIRWTDARIT